MRRLLAFTLMLAAAPLHAATWHVAANGGNRGRSGVPQQCDGTMSAAYPGTSSALWYAGQTWPSGYQIIDNAEYYYTWSGGMTGSSAPTWGASAVSDNGGTWTRGAAYPINQHCPFNDWRYLYDDRSYNGIVAGWVISGGDEVIISGCWNQFDSTADCRTGSDPPGIPDTWCVGNSVSACSSGPIPAGTSGTHTRFYGACVLASTCNSGNQTVYANLQQIFGGNGVGTVVNLQSTSYVDWVGIEVTDHAQCAQYETAFYQFPTPCAGSPNQDYATNGIATNNTTNTLLLQDVWVHGLGESGVSGAVGAGTITLNRVFIGFNGFAGWDLAGGGADQQNGTGASIAASYVTMEGNGCNEEYPIVHAFPAISCYDLNTGGFGDSWSGQTVEPGGAASVLASFTCSHCAQFYNTKDGFIGPHTINNNLVVTDSISYGNMGQQWKWGQNNDGTGGMYNTLTVGNCNRMAETIPGAAHNFNRGSYDATPTATGTSGAYTITVSSNAGINVGDAVYGTGIGNNAAVTAISGTTITLSIANSGTVSGTASFNYGGAQLSLFCRASGDMFSFFPAPGSSFTFGNNTVAGYSATVFDMSCIQTNTCSSSVLNYIGNIFLGYLNEDPTYYVDGVTVPGLFYYSDSSVVPASTYNIEWNLKNYDACGVNHILCDDPLLYNEPANPLTLESQMDELTLAGGFKLASTSSPAWEAGTTYSGQPSLFSAQCGANGQTSPLTIGGCGPVSSVQINGDITIHGSGISITF